MKLNHTLMARKGYHDDASIQEAQKRAGVSVTTPDEESLMTIKRSLIVAEKMGIQEHPPRSSVKDCFPAGCRLNSSMKWSVTH
jgi:hypothetical protein